MAKVRIDTSRITKKIEDTFRDLMTKDAIYVEIANFSKERIQSFARLQKRMEQDGADKVPMPKLSKNYIEYRRKQSYWRTINGKKVKFEGADPEHKGTDKFFFPNVTRSQLTLTGQLLRGLTAKIIRKGIDKGKIEIEISGSRDDGKTNKQIYKYLNDRDSGYNILALSKKAIERIRTIVLNQLRKELVKRKLK